MRAAPSPPIYQATALQLLPTALRRSQVHLKSRDESYAKGFRYLDVQHIHLVRLQVVEVLTQRL